MTAVEIKQFRAVRKEAGRHIDPATAEVMWRYAQTLDPYGIKELPEECQQIGREYFARSPGGDMWVSFDDLPKDVRDKLRDMHRHELAFPAGLADMFDAAIAELRRRGELD